MICATALGDELYQFAGEIPIRGEGGWDILTIDSAASRLYLAHGTKVVVVDLTTLRTVSKIDTGPNPDAVVYEPGHGEVYVFNHTGNSVTVINAKAATVSATIQLDGNPEFAAVDEAAGLVYCNVEDKSEVASLMRPNMKSSRVGPLRREKNQPASLWTRGIIVCSPVVTIK